MIAMAVCWCNRAAWAWCGAMSRRALTLRKARYVDIRDAGVSCDGCVHGHPIFGQSFGRCSGRDDLERVAFYQIQTCIFKGEAAFAPHNAFTFGDEFNSTQHALSDAQMLTIAREFNLSETIFVMRPADPANTAHVRIFFPTAEIPFAGHPTIGCAILLAEAAMGGGADQ